MSAPSILTVSAVARLSPLVPAAPFRNVGGVGEAPPVNTRPAPAIVPKVEFDCVFGHNAKPAATSFQPFEVLKALSNVEGLSALSYRERRQNTVDRRQNEKAKHKTNHESTPPLFFRVFLIGSCFRLSRLSSFSRFSRYRKAFRVLLLTAYFLLPTYLSVPI
jgi:hypothetical protein